MSLSRKLNIMGREFVVEEAALDEENCGSSDTVFRVIHVDASLPDDTKVETFYHEILHVMVGLGGFDKLLDEKLEEALVQYLGQALSHFLTYNENLPVGHKI